MDQTEYERLWKETSEVLARVNTRIEALRPKTPKVTKQGQSLKKLSDRLLSDLETMWKEFNRAPKA
jgi:hypothetical protein